MNSNHKALQCDGCQSWSHIRCVGVSHRVYGELQCKSTFSWQCTSCLFSELPSFDVFESSFDVKDELGVDNSSAHSTLDLLSTDLAGIRVVNHNIQGIRSKQTELTQWFEASANKDTIFCFTETWIKPSDPPLTVNGFTVYTSPLLLRTGQSSYLPGSCLVISNAMTVERPPLCESLEKSCNALNVVCCFIVCKCAKVAVLSVYRSPSTAVKAGLDNLRLIISELEPNTLLSLVISMWTYLLTLVLPLSTRI